MICRFYCNNKGHNYDIRDVRWSLILWALLNRKYDLRLLFFLTCRNVATSRDVLEMIQFERNDLRRKALI